MNLNIIILPVIYILCAISVTFCMEYRGVVPNGVKSRLPSEDSKPVCFEYNTRLFGFYFLQVGYNVARASCSHIWGAELYSPEEGDLIPLTKAYRAWNKKCKHPFQFWTKYVTGKKLNDANAFWAIIKADMNTISSNSSTSKGKDIESFSAVYVDTSAVKLKYPLLLHPKDYNKAFICAGMHPEYCREIQKAESFDDVFPPSVNPKDCNCLLNKTINHECPSRKAIPCHTRKCFTYGGRLFEYHNHSKAWMKANSSCEDAGLEMYRPKSLEEMKEISQKLWRDGMFASIPGTFWIGLPGNCDSFQLEDPLCYIFADIIFLKKFFSKNDPKWRGRTEPYVEVHMTDNFFLYKTFIDDKHTFICAKNLNNSCCLPTEKPGTESSTSIMTVTVEDETTEPTNISDDSTAKHTTTETTNVSVTSTTEGKTTEASNVSDDSTAEDTTTETSNVSDYSTAKDTTAVTTNSTAKHTTTEATNVSVTSTIEDKTTEASNVSDDSTAEDTTTETRNVSDYSTAKDTTAVTTNISDDTTAEDMTVEATDASDDSTAEDTTAGTTYVPHDSTAEDTTAETTNASNDPTAEDSTAETTNVSDNSTTEDTNTETTNVFDDSTAEEMTARITNISDDSTAEDTTTETTNISDDSTVVYTSAETTNDLTEETTPADKSNVSDDATTDTTTLSGDSLTEDTTTDATTVSSSRKTPTTDETDSSSISGDDGNGTTVQERKYFHFNFGSLQFSFHETPANWDVAKDICRKSCQKMFSPDSATRVRIIAQLLDLRKGNKGEPMRFWTGNSVCTASAFPGLYAAKDVILRCFNKFAEKKYSDIVFGGYCKKTAIALSKEVKFIHLEADEELPFICSGTATPNTAPHHCNDSSSEDRFRPTVYLLSKYNGTSETLLNVSDAISNFLNFARDYCPKKNIEKPFKKLSGSKILLEIGKQVSENRYPNSTSILQSAKLPWMPNISSKAVSQSPIVGKNNNFKYKIMLRLKDWKSAKKYCERNGYELFSPSSIKEMEDYAKTLNSLVSDRNRWFWTSDIVCKSSKAIFPSQKFEDVKELFLRYFPDQLTFEAVDKECNNVAVSLTTQINFRAVPSVTKLRFICTQRLEQFVPPCSTTSDPDFITDNETDINDSSNVTTVPTTTVSTTTVLYRKPYCKSTKEYNIHWPRTHFGGKSFGRCPRGQYGRAEWNCSGDTGKFEGEPFIDCKDINCSESSNASYDKRYLESYLVERLIVCGNKETKPEEDMDSLMGTMREKRKKLIRPPSGSNKQALVKASREREEMVNVALGVFDRLIEADVDIWDKIEKPRRKAISMEIIKEAEETAWVMGCSKKASRFRKVNLAMQVVPLNGATDIKFEVSDDKEDFAILPANTMPNTKEKCGEQVNTAVASTYSHIQKRLLEDDGRYTVTSNIMGISVGDFSTSYNFTDEDKIKIRLYHPERPDNAKAKCVFLNWNPPSTSKYGVWDTYGCETLNSTATDYTECLCDHLTNFAILMDFTGNQTDDYGLSMLSLVFSILSSVSLILVIFVYISVKSVRNMRNTITCNLAACLLFMNILVQTGLERAGNFRCFVISALLQYCVLSAFLWMLLEGALLYKMVIVVFETAKIRLPVLYAIAYGIPLVIVLISSSLRPAQMVRINYCWPSPEKGMIWSVVGPIALIITVNIIVFAMTMNAAIRIDRMHSNNKSIRERKNSLILRVKGMISLTCLLGFTWIIGFFYVPSNPAPVAYLFVTLNGLQGLFLLVTQIILNNHVRHKLFVIYKENMAKFTGTTSTWNAFLPVTKQPPQIKVIADDNTIVFSDIGQTRSVVDDSSVYATAPPLEPVDDPSSNSRISVLKDPKISAFEEDMRLRHPFEINY